MIRTEWQADAEYFALPLFRTFDPAVERANRIRCAQEDVEEARRMYVIRRRQIGMANRATGWMAKSDRSMAFIMFNKARHAMLRAEKKLAKVMEG
jgi:hypothetical protein